MSAITFLSKPGEGVTPPTDNSLHNSILWAPATWALIAD